MIQNHFVDHSNTKNDIYNNINDYNPSRKQKIFNCVWWLIKYFNP